MTDTQLTLILSALGTGCAALIAALKWSVGRIVKSQDGATKAIIGNTASNAVLVTKLDAVVTKIERISDFVDDMVPEFPRYRPNGRMPTRDE